MEWRSFTKRLVGVLVICTPIALIIGALFFGRWDSTILLLSLVFEGLILLIFGVCLLTPLVEGFALSRYRVDPVTTRDTVRHFDRRRREQTSSGVVIIAAGLVILCIALLYNFVIVPFFP